MLKIDRNYFFKGKEFLYFFVLLAEEQKNYKMTRNKVYIKF